MSPQQLSSDQLIEKPAPGSAPGPEFGRARQSPKPNSRWLRVGLIILGLAGALSGGAYLLASGNAQHGKHAGQQHAEGAS